VYVDEEFVTLELEEGDDLTSMVAGKSVSDVFEKVNFHTTYKFGKCSFIFVCFVLNHLCM